VSEPVLSEAGSVYQRRVEGPETPDPPEFPEPPPPPPPPPPPSPAEPRDPPEPDVTARPGSWFRRPASTRRPRFGGRHQPCARAARL